MLGVRRRLGGRAVERCAQRPIHRSNGLGERPAGNGGASESDRAAAYADDRSRPERPMSTKYFEYVINFYGSYAGIFHYPTSDQQIGTINDVGGQGCTNVLHGYGHRTFWIIAAL